MLLKLLIYWFAACNRYGMCAEFFTSFIDLQLNFNYTSCVTGRTIDPEMWLEGQPNNIGGFESCTAVQLGEHCIGFFDLICTQMEHQILCEVIASVNLYLFDINCVWSKTLIICAWFFYFLYFVIKIVSVVK